MFQKATFSTNPYSFRQATQAIGQIIKMAQSKKIGKMSFKPIYAYVHLLKQVTSTAMFLILIKAKLQLSMVLHGRYDSKMDGNGQR